MHVLCMEDPAEIRRIADHTRGTSPHVAKILLDPPVMYTDPSCIG